jgi:hypothetical protein
MQSIKRISIAVLATFGLLLTSCSSTEPTQVEPKITAETGTLALPLVTSAGGHTYQLTGSFYVYPYYNWYTADGDSEQLNISLTTGDYALYLYYWQLYRVSADGSWSPVTARLLSNYQTFSIYNNSTSSVSFQFETDGIIVTTGLGTLDVNVEVTEVAPNCVPLSDDCGEGYWCPPGELVSHTPACIPVGGAALGETCRNPSDCVGNASCIDLGTGATCVALCGASEFDTDCDSGGLCTPQGVDYGLCAPETDPGDAGANSDGGAVSSDAG